MLTPIFLKELKITFPLIWYNDPLNGFVDGRDACFWNSYWNIYTIKIDYDLSFIEDIKTRVHMVWWVNYPVGQSLKNHIRVYDVKRRPNGLYGTLIFQAFKESHLNLDLEFGFRTLISPTSQKRKKKFDFKKNCKKESDWQI